VGAGYQRWWREPLDTHETIEREYRRLAELGMTGNLFAGEGPTGKLPDWWYHWTPVRNSDPGILSVYPPNWPTRRLAT
jgi:hypothetical protein